MFKIAKSIRLKLTLWSLLPLVVTILFCAMTGVYLINTRINYLAQEKVRTDLNSAKEIYNNEIGRIRQVVRFAAGTSPSSGFFETGDVNRIGQYLKNLRQNEQLDILTLVDIKGRVVYRSGNPAFFGDLRRGDFFVERALQGGFVAGTELFDSKRLALEGKELQSQATISIIPTERGKISTERSETRGMLMLAAAPVFANNGDIVGAIYGANLLNRNNTVVDKIKQIVYEGVLYEGKEVGTATIFLDATRISTNVQTIEGVRAIGTRLSSQVYERVIKKKEKWADRAFVVNDWYYSAYEPIFDLRGAVIGSLYVGMLEQPQNALKRKVGFLFGGLLLLGSLFGVIVSGYVGNLLARPIRELKTVVQKFSAGERGVQIEINSEDEIGELALEFNAMTEKIMSGEAEIKELNRNLELKVQERTSELEAKTEQLLETQKDLVKAEKLAAVGELAAGVAHEVNNPMAIIRGNAEVLLMELPPDHSNREEATVIAQQVGRVEKIVGNLLTFARQQKIEVDKVNLAALLEDILQQLHHHIPLGSIEIVREYADKQIEIEGDQSKLCQVFTNLIVNGVQAMGENGTLTVRTGFDSDRKNCKIEIEDCGTGIPTEHINNIFTPFFTTKPNGTGLGLSVSYGIVKKHKGTIEMESREGGGSRFVVTLPVFQRNFIK